MMTDRRLYAPDDLPTGEEFPDEAMDPAMDELEAEFASLLEEHLPGKERMGRGKAFEGTVAAVLDEVVMINYGGKEDAAVPMSEFTDARGECRARVGDQVAVTVVGNRNGMPILSHRRARAAAAQASLVEAFEKGLPVRGIVEQEVKGGLVVDLGMRAFMPASHVDLFRVGDLKSFIGQEIEAIIIDFDQADRKVVLSRRNLLEQRRKAAQSEFISKVEPGSIVKGTVREILPFGAFVSLGGIDGLIPRSEISWDPAADPAEVIKVGDEVEVKVLDVAPESGKITLSRRRLHEDPWATAPARYKIGSIISGRVVKLQEFGAFVHIEEGLTGLIHVSNTTWDATTQSSSWAGNVGDTVTAQILEVDPAKKRIALGLKQLTQDPWSVIRKTYPVGSLQKGTVIAIKPFGAIVRLADGTEGMLHVSELSWEKRINDPSEVVKMEEEIEVKVIKIDDEKRRLGLSLRAKQKSPIEAFVAEHPEGSVLTGLVTRIVPFGVFVDLGRGLEGMIHISELDEQRVESPEKVVKVGEEVTVKVLKVEARKQKVGLSRKAAIKAPERENIRQYIKQGRDENVGASLGDLLSAAMKKQ